MKWEQSGNKLGTKWEQSGLKWEQINVPSCYRLLPVVVPSENDLIIWFLRRCSHCYHFFKRAYIGFYIFSFGVWFYSASRNYKSLAIQGFREKALKIDFKASFLYLTGLLWTNNKSLRFDTFPGMLKLTPVKLNAILKP